MKSGIKELIKNPLQPLKNFGNGIANRYEAYVRNKAIESVNQKISTKGLNIDAISESDYEAMVSDECKDIKNSHSSKITKVALSLLGLDLLT